MKAGVFCHNGLGDGVNCLVLSHNLHLNGWEVETYQNSIGSMQAWFPHLPVQPYPDLKELPNILSKYDLFLVVQNDTDSFVLEIIKQGKERFPEKIKVLYLYPSPNIVNEPYYADCLTDPKKTIAENLCNLCRNVLKLPNVVKENGFTPPKNLSFRKHPKRVVIHPTSARKTRNWPKKQFVKLALHLESLSYEVVFIPGTEIANWQDQKERVRSFNSLDDLSCFLYESGVLIGNDSGLGHLASALGVSTLTLCRRKAWAALWAPGFAKNLVVTPPSWIPNIRGFRLRDRQWRRFITLGKVLKSFRQLQT